MNRNKLMEIKKLEGSQLSLGIERNREIALILPIWEPDFLGKMVRGYTSIYGSYIYIIVIRDNSSAQEKEAGWLHHGAIKGRNTSACPPS